MGPTIESESDVYSQTHDISIKMKQKDICEDFKLKKINESSDCIELSKRYVVRNNIIPLSLEQLMTILFLCYLYCKVCFDGVISANLIEFSEENIEKFSHFILLQALFIHYIYTIKITVLSITIRYHYIPSSFTSTQQVKYLAHKN